MKGKWLLGGGILALLLIGAFILNVLSSPTGARNEDVSLESRFASLSAAGTNLCAKADFVEVKSDDERLQGSCCSKMDFHRYTEQVEGLRKYAHIAEIPSDPYDIPVPLAKKLLDFRDTIELTAEQQAIYDGAMALSHEGGPCCCRCWRWDAFEGLAKFLITEHGFTPQQIADVWDLSDGCGGKGHQHGDSSVL
jgi:hypothetical protein